MRKGSKVEFLSQAIKIGAIIEKRHLYAASYYKASEVPFTKNPLECYSFLVSMFQTIFTDYCKGCSTKYQFLTDH